jgi:hypothetical protein
LSSRPGSAGRRHPLAPAPGADSDATSSSPLFRRSAFVALADLGAIAISGQRKIRIGSKRANASAFVSGVRRFFRPFSALSRVPRSPIATDCDSYLGGINSSASTAPFRHPCRPPRRKRKVDRWRMETATLRPCLVDSTSQGASRALPLPGQQWMSPEHRAPPPPPAQTSRVPRVRAPRDYECQYIWPTEAKN